MTDARIQKAKWRSRRGMRELDVLLADYIDGYCATMNDAQWSTFEALLEESDMDLYAWFTRRSRPDDPDYAKLVDVICQRGAG